MDLVGLGIMGKPMVLNLLQAGCSVVVVGHTNNAVLEEILEAGAEVASFPMDLGSQVRTVITMLPNSPEVGEVVLGEKGLIKALQKGSIVVDMSFIAPLVSREIADELGKCEVRMLDAPVRGGEPKAIAHFLSACGGAS